VFLGRSPDEPVDRDLEGWYRALLGALRDPALRSGAWRLCERSGWPGNDRWSQLVAWCWEGRAAGEAAAQAAPAEGAPAGPAQEAPAARAPVEGAPAAGEAGPTATPGDGALPADPDRWLVVVNLGAEPAAGHVTVPPSWSAVRGRAVRLVDPVNGAAFDRPGDALLDGLYVELGPWGSHLFSVRLAARQPDPREEA
jgi:hypothetical protein